MSWSPSVPERVEQLSQRALAHIAVLADQIGPRPAGSPAERQALDYLGGLLTTWGYEVHREGVAFASSVPYSVPYLVGAVCLGIAGWFSKDFPWLGLVLPFLFMVLPQWSRGWTQRRKPTGAAENLYARIAQGDPTSPPALLFCAHIDTAPAIPLRHPVLLSLYSRTLDILQRFAWMIFALALLQSWGWQVANGLRYAVAGLGSLGGFWLACLQLLPALRKDELVFSPGANDNASGVGVLLALAEEIAQQEIRLGTVAFLFTTAEESGLFGARDFVQSHSEWANETDVICVDMVGNGDRLYWVVKEGVFNPLYTSAELGQALKQANPALQPLWHTLRSGDYAPFCQAGFRVTSLECGGRTLTDPSYHSVFDTVEKINVQMLSQVLQTLLAFLEQTDPQRSIYKRQDDPLRHQKEKSASHTDDHKKQD